MTAVRVALAVAIASAALFAGAAAGGAFTHGPPERARSAGAAYPGGAGEIPVGDALEVSGQPMRLSLFYTSDSPQRVARFYADAFRARGLLPVVGAEEPLAHASAFGAATGLQRFISAVPQPGGQTLVLIGTANPRKPPRFMRGAEAASFPVPTEHRAFLGFRSADAEVRAESAQFVSALAPSEVAAFYRQALTAQGFSELSGGSESLLAFARPGETLAVALQELERAKGAAVFVSRIEGDLR
jgi:hypothetical protein